MPIRIELTKLRASVGVAGYRPVVDCSTLPKLFCFHDVTNGLGVYDDFADKAADNISVYGIKLSSSSVGPYVLSDLVENYLRTIEGTEPTGPYYLVGYSFGATLAFLVARELERKGKEVAYLGLIDGIMPTLIKSPERFAGELCFLLSHINFPWKIEGFSASLNLENPAQKEALIRYLAAVSPQEQLEKVNLEAEFGPMHQLWATVKSLLMAVANFSLDAEEDRPAAGGAGAEAPPRVSGHKLKAIEISLYTTAETVSRLAAYSELNSAFVPSLGWGLMTECNQAVCRLDTGITHSSLFKNPEHRLALTHSVFEALEGLVSGAVKVASAAVTISAMNSLVSSFLEPLLHNPHYRERAEYALMLLSNLKEVFAPEQAIVAELMSARATAHSHPRRVDRDPATLSYGVSAINRHAPLTQRQADALAAAGLFRDAKGEIRAIPVAAGAGAGTEVIGRTDGDAPAIAVGVEARAVGEGSTELTTSLIGVVTPGLYV